MPTAVVAVQMPNQQMSIEATVQRTPLTVLDVNVLQNPPGAKALQPAALSEVWWGFRARFVGHARLGYSSLPLPPLPGIAASTAPFNIDAAGALDLSWENRVDVKGNRLLGGMTIAWIDDGSITVPTLVITPLEPPGNATQVPVRDIPLYSSAVAPVPMGTVTRWAFIPDATLDALFPNRDQGVVLFSTGDGRVVGAVRWDRVQRTVVSLSVSTAPDVPPGELPPFATLWGKVDSTPCGFPQKTENNEQRTTNPTPVDSQEIVRTVDMKRELFLDGPGWLVSGAPALKSLVVDVLDLRGQSQEGDPFPATVTVDGQPLTAGQDFGTNTVISYSNIQLGTLSDVALRFLWIPASVLA